MKEGSPVSGASPADVKRYRENYQGEVDGVALYLAMAEAERSAPLRELYRRLAEAEQRHGAVWARKLEEAGLRPADVRPSWRARLLMAIARRFGAGVIVATVAGRERADRGMYDTQPEAQGTSLPRDERSHARLFHELSGGSGLQGGVLARIEGRHRASGGNALRAAVLGANDGLVSNLSLVMGVAGAAGTNAAVIVAGFAGLLAGAMSMALGEWLSVQSARELYAHQIEVEAEELTAIPEEEEAELTLIYQAKGVPEAQARLLAAQIIGGESGRALDTLAREELGIDPDELGGSAYVAAGTSFLLFSLGAIVPLAPFLVLHGTAGIVTSLACSAAALMAVGAAITVVTGTDALRSGLRQVVFGLVAAAITFTIGSLVGRVVG